MLERYLQTVSCVDAGVEEPAVTRERLKDRFPRGATRRMTQLGLLVGVALDDVKPAAGDAIVYASAFGESRALEGFLDSFPAASPTLFQTSIHPSAVQQVLIGRQHPVGEFFPLTGRDHLVAHAVQAALLSPAARVLLCGGDERGTWLLEHHAASDRSFGFALALAAEATGGLGRLRLAPVAADLAVAAFTLPEFFSALVTRTPLNVIAAPGLRLELEWR
jgi:hypothetical protein